jgi:hypothetical protein
VGKPEGKIPLRRHTYRLDDNIKMGIKGIEWDVVDWINLAQDKDKWRWGNLKERDHFEGMCTDWMIILKCILNEWGGGVDRINLAQDKHSWRCGNIQITNIYRPAEHLYSFNTATCFGRSYRPSSGFVYIV